MVVVGGGAFVLILVGAVIMVRIDVLAIRSIAFLSWIMKENDFCQCFPIHSITLTIPIYLELAYSVTNLLFYLQLLRAHSLLLDFMSIL